MNRDGDGRLRRFEQDDVALATTAFGFTLALGASSVAFPLVALDRGRGAAEIGVLVALSAVVQIVARSQLGRLMRLVPDRVLLSFAPIALAASFGALLISSSLIGLAGAWIVLGLARACFWTAGQTHAVRGSGTPAKRLASLNFFGSVGALVGPVVAGVLAEVAVELTLAVGAAVAAVAFLPTLVLERFPAFSRVAARRESSLWRRPGVDAACGAGATAGAWRGLMDGFVPVALEGAGHSPAAIGALVSVGNAAAVAGTVVIARLGPSRTAAVYTGSMLSAALGMAAFGYSAGTAVAAAAALGLSGLGAGVLQTLGPTLAAAAVASDEKGDVMAVYGTSRTSAMFLSPLAMAAAVVVVPLSAAFALVGLTLAVPTFAVRSLKRDQTGPSPRPDDP